MKLKTIGICCVDCRRSCRVRDRFGTSQAKPRQEENGAAAAAAADLLCFDSCRSRSARAKGGMKFTYANACYARKGRRQSRVAGRLRDAKAHRRHKKKMAKPAKKEAT